MHKSVKAGWVQELRSHEFFTPVCADICERYYQATHAFRVKQSESRRMELIRCRIALLLEHRNHCHDPETKARMNRTLEYQAQLMEKPGAVFFRFDTAS